jgi:FkbH-like protein
MIQEAAAAPTVAELRATFAASPTLATAQHVLDSIGPASRGAPRTALRLMILRSFTIEPAIPLLRAAAALEGVDLEVRIGGFNAYAQEILDPASALYAYAPDVVLLAVQTRDLLPRSWSAYADDPDDAAREADEAVGAIATWVARLRERSTARLLFQGLELPAWPSAGILDGQSARGQVALLQSVNDRLRRLGEDTAAMDVIDYDALVARYGRLRWHDETKFLTARMPIAADCLHRLAAEYLRYLLPAAARTRKVLVVDLDDTLWGGVVGEVGSDGIKLDGAYPGGAYRALQRAILDLHRRGVILAIASKNNPADAAEVLDRHPEMLLRPAHFSATRINWNDKAESLREIAAELNLGLDSIAFLDNSPSEQERVRQELPEVYVVPLNGRPETYADQVRACPVFERVALSVEDRDRGRLYAEERLRSGLREQSGSLEDFYRSLGMTARIEGVTSRNLTRVAQLTQKTNQFNLTTRRYNEEAIRDLAASGTHRIFAVSVQDRYGDNGLVGVAILALAGRVAEIDTFLLSCRVIGRTVETALLAEVAAAAMAAGATTLRGSFLATKKNAPAQPFYPDHGFTLVDDAGTEQRWALDLGAALPAVPPWIELVRD